MNRPWVVPLAVALAAIAVFSPALLCGFAYDDDLMLVRNAHYRGLSLEHIGWMFTSLRVGHWHPLTWFSFAIDHALWGMRPIGYHLTNLLLHGANAALVYALIAALVPGIGRGAAAAGALFFAVHPLRVESVVWITERRDVLSSAFVLLAVIAYVRHAREQRGRSYALSLAAFAASLLCKAWGMTLFGVLLALDAYPLRRLSRRALVEKVPYAVLGAAAAVMAMMAQADAGAAASWERHTFAHRTLQAAYGLAFYLVKTVVPIGLSPLHVMHAPPTLTQLMYALPAIGVPAAAAGVAASARRLPWLAAAATVYVLTVLPVLGFAQSGPQLVADRYTYLALLPAAVLLAAGVQRTASRAAFAMAGVLLAALAAGAFWYSLAWRDSATLWTHALEVDPSNYWAHNARGLARLEEGDARAAIADVDESIRIKPSFADAYVSRALAKIQLGDLRGAIADCDNALRLDPNHPVALGNRGAARRLLGDPGGIDDIEASMRLEPSNPAPYLNRGVARFEAGDLEGAIADFEACIRLQPHVGLARSYRAIVRQARGNVSGAMEDHDAAVRLSPRSPDVLFNRAVARASQGDARAALEDYDRALAVAPPGWPRRKAAEGARAALKP